MLPANREWINVLDRLDKDFSSIFNESLEMFLNWYFLAEYEIDFGTSLNKVF